MRAMTVTPLGDSALVLSLGDDVDDTVLMRVRGVADAIRTARIPGVVDVVAAFASVTLYYDLRTAGPFREFQTHVEAIAQRGADALAKLGDPRVVEIPVCYGGEFGPDLEEIAARAGLSLKDAIELHSKAEYRVHAIGFVPGFGYLGGLPKKLHAARRATPRPSVAAGSVGIGGAQTGIYPVVTPGGWNVIGRTPLYMFDPNRPVAALLAAGDEVRFRPVSAEEFASWKSA
jgi:inhibitor of KinA